ncbi:MAG: efflux RND transporter periplasmic adaptor subunit [Endomicrobium sp.]|jgi:macrolide-specific efflux system membrane fusion protein|nr:efflux RND transporter periplasmic adaptor subunit [Endomicrobium sp.]
MKKVFIILGIVIIIGISVKSIFNPSKQIVDKEAVLESRDLRTELRETGTVCPRNKLEIKSSFPTGRIERILVNEGDEIKKGQIIVWMSSNERATMIDAARVVSEQEYQRWQSIYKPAPIIAPMNGFITTKHRDEGQTVNSTDPILVMADDLIIRSYVDETNLKYIKVGREVSMYLDAYPDEKFTGIVEHISYDSYISNNVTNYIISIKSIRPPKEFRAGMTVTITITLESKKGVLSLPSEFITDKGQTKTVTVKTGKVKNRQTFETRDVKTGINDGKFAEILSGLNPGELVVVFKTETKKKKEEK